MIIRRLPSDLTYMYYMYHPTAIAAHGTATRAADRPYGGQMQYEACMSLPGSRELEREKLLLAEALGSQQSQCPYIPYSPRQL